jgi:hypothetical protein
VTDIDNTPEPAVTVATTPATVKRVRKPAAKAAPTVPLFDPPVPEDVEPVVEPTSAYRAPELPEAAAPITPPTEPGVADELQVSSFAIAGLVFAVIFPPLGILFSLLGLGQIRRGERSGRTIALLGAVLAVALTVTLALVGWAAAALLIGIIKALAVLLGAAAAPLV